MMNRKKKRSKSCISKIGEGVFSAREQREKSKESANKTYMLSDGSVRRVCGVREQSNLLLELNQLKKEINEEIRKERLSGTRQVISPVAQPAVKKEARKHSIGSNIPANYTSLRLSETQTQIVQQTVKPVERLNHSKIRKYIEKQKQQAQAKKSMQETIEHEKHIKVKETLFELQKFSRSKKRKMHNLKTTVNLNNVKQQLGLNSTQKLETKKKVKKS